jgi:Cdc6-like AAA superfamily ATPase
MIDRDFMEKKYGLKERPFKDRIARETWIETWTNREKQVEQWNRVIDDSVNSPNANYITFIIGDYGQGKSLSLMKIAKTAKGKKEILPIRLNFKSEEKAKKPGLDFVFRIFKSIDFEKLRIDKNSNINNAIKNIPVKFDEARKVIIKIMSGEKDMSDLASYFIRGEIELNKSQLKDFGIIRKIDSLDIGKEYLIAFLAFIKELGYTTLLLAIDEFEYLFSLVTKSQQNIYLALLRGLYDITADYEIPDNTIANMVFFIAISEDGWTYLNDLEKKERSSGGPVNPLLRRIDEKVTLEPFDKNQTKELIQNRLRCNRASGSFDDQPLIPFKDDFVDFIFEETKGVLEKIIVRCDHVLDAGVAERIPLLDRDFAERVLRERGF